jgi:hypothetical protein
MQTVPTQLEPGRTSAVTRPRSVATCATSTRVPTAASILGAFGTRGVTASAGTLGTTAAWSLYIRKPMPKVNFHDRWPLGFTT